MTNRMIGDLLPLCTGCRLFGAGDIKDDGSCLDLPDDRCHRCGKIGRYPTAIDRVFLTADGLRAIRYTYRPEGFPIGTALTFAYHREDEMDPVGKIPEEVQ